MYSLRERLSYTATTSVEWDTAAETTVKLWATGLGHYITEPYQDFRRFWMKNIGHRGVKIGQRLTYKENRYTVQDLGVNIKHIDYVVLRGVRLPIRRGGKKINAKEKPVIFDTPPIPFQNLIAEGIARPAMFSREINFIRQGVAKAKLPAITGPRVAMMGAAAVLAACSAATFQELSARVAEPLPAVRGMYLNEDEITRPTVLRPDGRPEYSSWDEYFERNPFTPPSNRTVSEAALEVMPEDRNRAFAIGGAEEVLEPQVEEQYSDRGF
jgi:hypothetical protein